MHTMGAAEADLGGGGGGFSGLQPPPPPPPKALKTHRKQYAGVQNYSTVRAQSTVRPEHEKKAGVPSARCCRAS